MEEIRAMTLMRTVIRARMSIGVDRLDTGLCLFFFFPFLNSSSTWILWLHLVCVVLSMGSFI